jgi:hypothetical protein
MGRAKSFEIDTRSFASQKEAVGPIFGSYSFYSPFTKLSCWIDTT